MNRYNSFLIIAAFSFLGFSCSAPVAENEGTTTTVSDTNDQQSTNVVESEVEKEEPLKRDPRFIGPAKGADQIHIEENLKKIDAAENPLFGLWVGSFGKNKITIAISYVQDDSIYGHSVCAGNFRAIKGTYNEVEPFVFNVNMKEPGDDKYDGEFNFTINTSKEELDGKWKPYNNSVSAKTYTLNKRTYTYNPNVGDFPKASTTWLEVPDVENMLPEEIEMIRNEIYARHGYSFTNLKIRRVFDAKDWYVPMSVDIREELTDIEAQNIDLLYNYEEYYDDYYNDYGR